RLVGRMGELASSMWRQAADAWYKRDRSAAFALDERDDEMDDLHVSLIAELASGRMTLPVTMEMTVVARLYERLGDNAGNIARWHGSTRIPAVRWTRCRPGRRPRRSAGRRRWSPRR